MTATPGFRTVQARLQACALAVAVLAGFPAAASELWQPPARLASRPPAAAPRDINGVWFTKLDRKMWPIDGSEPPFTPAGRALYDKRVQAERDGRPMADPSTFCKPHGVPRIMASPYPIQIFATPDQVAIIHEVNHNIRMIYLNEPAPEAPEPNFMGYSVGHWDGDTLVVETIGVSDESFLDEVGTPHSAGMKVTERMTKIDGGRKLQDRITIDDPIYYTRPWTAERVFDWRPDVRLLEYVCEENNRNVPDADNRTTAK